MSGRSNHLILVRRKDQARSIPPIELNQKLFLLSSEMPPTFQTTLLSGCRIQSVLLSPLRLHHHPPVLRSFFCQTSLRSTETNCTNGNEITTLGLFESQLLPENRYCEKNVMATATTFRYTLDTNRVSSSYPQGGGGVGNVHHTTITEDLVAVHPSSGQLTDQGWSASRDCVLIQYQRIERSQESHLR